MIRDAQSKMGCCFITYEENVNDYLWQSHFMTCVYEYVNYLQKPLYSKGKATSECDDVGEKYTTSDIYPNLCVSNESMSEKSISNENVIIESYDLDTLQSGYNENVSRYCQLEIEKCDGRRHIGCETDPGLAVTDSEIDSYWGLL